MERKESLELRQLHEIEIPKLGEQSLQAGKKSILNWFVGLLRKDIYVRRELNEKERRVKNLFFQSFRFSQGDPPLQDDIQKWLVLEGYFDDIHVQKNPPAYIQKMLIPKKHDLLADDSGRSVEIKNMWRRLNQAREIKQLLHADELLPIILDRMISRDLRYQHKNRPNRKTSGEVTPDSSNDPHASFIRNYIIYANSTGNDAFDELHQRLAPLIFNYRNTTPKNFRILEAIPNLAREWEYNHPGYTFFPQDE